MKSDVTNIAEFILDLERSLNERWSRGDCSGYLDTYAEDISYFDPMVEGLLVGRDAVVDHIRSLYQNPHIIRNEYLNPHVIVSEAGDMAVLSYNLKSFVADDVDGEKLIRSWNSTEVYSQIGGEWRIVHSNWALTQSLGLGVTVV